MSATVLSVATRALVAACGRLGLDPDPLLREVDLEPAELADPEARLPAEAVDAVWGAAIARSGDPALPLHVAEALAPGDFRTMHYLGAHSPTLGAALSRVARYFALVDPRVRLTTTPDGDAVVLRMEVPSAPVVPRQAAEFTLTAILLQTRSSTGVSWSPSRVDLEAAPPPHAAELRRVLGPVRFEQSETAMRVPRAWWDAPVRGADPALLQVLDRHADLLLERQPPAGPPDPLADVRRAIALELGSGAAPLAAVARRLGTSARSLQRRLEAAGTRFADLRDEALRAQAEALLRDPAMAIAEIGWLLGFSEPSAFTRAFRRWTGRTPGAWRRDLAGGQVPSRSSTDR